MLARRKIAMTKRHQPDVSPQRASANETAWEALTDAKRRVANDRLALIQPIADLIACGVSMSAAVKRIIGDIANGDMPGVYMELVNEHGRNGKISRATFINWVNAFTNGGRMGLAPKHRGGSRPEYGWEARFNFLYQSPTRPAINTVAYWLRGEGFDSATNSRVYSYAKSLPATAGADSRRRSGGHFYDQNIKPPRILDATVLPVGYMYEGDGHLCDVYVQHPSSGGHYRPEVTVWIDKRSNYAVAWTLEESENALHALRSLITAFGSYDHVPAEIHVDPGPGFKNSTVSDEITGVCGKLNIRADFAITGNARGKGLIEGWFAHFEERCGKRFETYCGHCRTDDQLSRLEYKIRRGKISAPSFDEYKLAIDEYFARYNTEVQRNLGAAPADIWQQLERVPLSIPLADLWLQREQRVVRKSGVHIDNKVYRSNTLELYNGDTVVVEVNPSDGSYVSIRDADGRWICDALHAAAQPYQSESRIAESKQRRLEGQVKRLNAKRDELERRAGMALDHTDTLEGLNDFVDEPERIDDTPAAEMTFELGDFIGPMDGDVEPILPEKRPAKNSIADDLYFLDTERTDDQTD